MEHDFDNADGASPFRLGTGAEPGDSGVNADEKKRLTEFSSRYNGGKEPKERYPRASEGTVETQCLCEFLERAGSCRKG